MSFDSRDILNLRRLHVEMLRYINSAELQVLRSLDSIKESITSTALIHAVEDHRIETEEQLSRLNWIFVELGLERTGWHANGIQGLLDDLEALPVFIKDPTLLDVAIVGSLTTLARCEEALYVNSCTYARLLGSDKQAKALSESLSEESRMVRRLSDLAQTGIYEMVTPRATGFLY